MIKPSLLLFILMLVTHYSPAQDLIHATVDTGFHLYILMGQSNMAGRGDVTSDYKDEQHPRVYTLTRENKWVPARHPLHFDKPAAGVGPGLAFAQKMAERYPTAKIGLIPCAVGGTAIRHWKPGAFDESTNTHPYDDATARIKIAMKSGVIKGMLWHQGESDSSPEKHEIYLNSFHTLVDSIRSITGNATLPVIAGELGSFNNEFRTFNVNVLSKVPLEIRHAELVTSEGLVHKGDNIHFSAASAVMLGKRFADKMIELLNPAGDK